MGKPYKRCKWCFARVPTNTKLLSGSDLDGFKRPLVHPVSVGDVLCKKCLTSATYNACEPLEDITTGVTSDDNPEPYKKIKLEVPKSGSGSSYCIGCGTKKAGKRPF